MSAARGSGWKLLCVTGLYSGLVPITPATWGSLLASAIYVVAALAAPALGIPRARVELFALLGAVVATVLSVRLGDWAVAHFGRKDPKPFVLDEFAGQWIALLGAAGTHAHPAALLAHVGIQFLLFRIIDVIKPPPARQLERLRAGWGIVADDVVSGIYTNALGWALLTFTPTHTWALSALAWIGIRS